MSNYYQKQDSKVAIMSVLAENGWKIYGYKPDESDSYTDYWSPAHWEGIATKNGFVLLVDQYSTHYSGYEVKKYNYNVKGTSADICAKIQKLQATINDKAASENEKEVCKRKIKALENKEGDKPTYDVIEVYPTFKYANPKSCTWHIEKDGEIIAKGKGLTNIYECNSRENTRINAEQFVSKIEEKINGFDSLVPVQKKVVKKVVKPVEITDRKELQVGDVLAFEYHGHYWEVYDVNEKTFSYELLGSEKRGYQKRKNPKRYYDTMKSFNKNIENGRIKIYEIKEIEEVTYKTVYVKSTRKGQQENLLPTEEITTETSVKTENNNNDTIALEVKENEKLNGIELYFNNKPSKNVIGMLKENGFRWHNKKVCWYAKKNNDTVSIVEAIQLILNDVNEETKEQMQEQENTLVKNHITENENVCHENIEIQQNEKLESLEAELKEVENKINEKYQMFVNAANSRSGSFLETITDLQKEAKQLRGNILKVKNESLNQLFYNDSLTDGQNCRINILMNKWKDNNKYTFKAIYKDQTHESNIILHVIGSSNYKGYFVICADGSIFSRSSIDSIFDKVDLLYSFEEKSPENENIEQLEACKNEDVPENHITANEKDHCENGITYRHNTDLNSIEITFNTKPSEEIRSLLKANRFRWARMKKVWYKKNPTEKDFAFVESLGSIKNDYNSNENITLNSFDYPEINIDDIENYTIPEDIQKREHDSNWITRKIRIDHNKEIQDLFSSYQSKVLEVIKTTDNKRIQYDLKRSLQYFKKHYHESYLKWMTMKANNPSWIVTGRSGLNVSRYNKKMEQINNHMLNLSTLRNELEKRIKKAENQIHKDKNKRMLEAVNNTNIDITFTTKTKEFVYMNTHDKRRVYTYKDYWICKLYGCYRVFKGNKEIYSTKTTDKLEVAKKYVAYQVQQEQLEKAI